VGGVHFGFGVGVEVVIAAGVNWPVAQEEEVGEKGAEENDTGAGAYQALLPAGPF